MQFKHFTLLAISALTSLFLLTTSCKKSSSTSSNSVSASVGSTNFSSGTTVGGYSPSIDLLGIVSYIVQNKDTTGFQLTMPLKVKVGQPFSSDSTVLEVVYQASTGTAYDSYSGHAVATINSLDTTGHKVSGVFSAVAYDSGTDSVVITNGKFSTSYTVQ